MPCINARPARGEGHRDLLGIARLHRQRPSGTAREIPFTFAAESDIRRDLVCRRLDRRGDRRDGRLEADAQEDDLRAGFLLGHGNGVERIRRLAPETLQLDADQSWLINPGSVGQPRDGDPRAAWILWDSDERVVTFCRTAYDVRAAQRKILDAGLPEILALRLEAGK